MGHQYFCATPFGLRLMAITLIFSITGCAEKATCKIQMVNSAAGIGSMQRLVVGIENDLSEHSHVDLADPSKGGSVELHLLASQLDRLASGEQSSKGKFRYEIVAGDVFLKKNCEGELQKCASEIAQTLLASCPGI